MDVVTQLRRGYESGLTRPLEWRLGQLGQLRRMLAERESEWLGALAADLRKSPTEGRATDLAVVDLEVADLQRQLRRWLEPAAVRVPMRLGIGRARVVSEPLGVVLVISPWNYPVQLLLLPMAFALAAGNVVVGKPSELAPATSALAARLVPEYLDERAVALVEGGPEETTALLEERWDHIFYTGNGRVGRIVMQAAARHLTPVTLELGGKNPTIVDRDVDLTVAARRIAWGKFMNAGQTCVAPDYVLVHRDVQDDLVAKLAGVVRDFYGDNPQASADYARIVNERHHQRLAGLLAGVEPARIVTGGQVDAADRYIAPTIVRDVAWDEAMMAEEVFGPILPVLPVPDITTAIEMVNTHPKPLALYVFSSSPGVAERVVERTSSGGACVNGTVLQFIQPGFPTGGVGDSGMGAYHGRVGVETFSHRKGVLERATWFDPSVTYPPYSRLKDRVLRRLF